MNEDKATRYHRLTRRATVLALLWSGGLLTLLAFTDLTFALSDFSESLVPAAAPFRRSLVVTTYVLLLALLHEFGALPIGFYSGYLLERRFGLCRQTPAGWLVDHMKAGAVGLGFTAGAAVLVYATLVRWPGGWWAICGVVLALVTVLLARLAPVLLLPIFYRLRPLTRDELRDRLVRLAERAGARVMGVFEWTLSDRTARANAALTGLGATRRILLSDTLLEGFSDEEIEVILAHELAHHVYGDIWVGIAWESALTLGALYLADAVLRAVLGPLGLRGPGDVAGLPILALTLGAVSLVVLPLFNALSRAHERRADRFALAITGNPTAFVSAMRRLGAQNLAEERPSRPVEILFHTHPPLAQRIDMAKGPP